MLYSILADDLYYCAAMVILGFLGFAVGLILGGLVILLT
jgi:hypothetical protein